MTKADLLEAMAAHAGITRAQAGAALDGLLDTITDALKGGEKVTLVGFGTLGVSQRAARTGRNPRTGEPVSIPARRVATFKPGKRLADALRT